MSDERVRIEAAAMQLGISVQDLRKRLAVLPQNDATSHVLLGLQQTADEITHVTQPILEILREHDELKRKLGANGIR
jgi:hypothetical protein